MDLESRECHPDADFPLGSSGSRCDALWMEKQLPSDSPSSDAMRWAGRYRYFHLTDEKTEAQLKHCLWP